MESECGVKLALLDKVTARIDDLALGSVEVENLTGFPREKIDNIRRGHIDSIDALMVLLRRLGVEVELKVVTKSETPGIPKLGTRT